MSLTLLNNISALYAENNLSSTQSKLQTTLQQLSSGTRINSGADDPAGLAISDGLGANEAALSQSSQNAADGIGLLQTADGALSQVTSLLDQAVTLATESANGTLTSGQVSSANQEYQNILSQIGNIGATTNFNSSNVFSSSATNIVVTDGTSSGLNTYADIVGSLNTGSVGTTAAAAVTTSALAPTSITGPVAAQNNTAGQYTFATNNNTTDTVSGTFTFAVGSGSQSSINVTPGTTLTQLAGQLEATSSFTGAGLSASINGVTGNLVILGATTGLNAAANTVSFTGTNLEDAVSANVAVANGVTAAPASSTTSSLTFSGAGVSGTDVLSGDISYQVGTGSAQTFALAAGTTINATGTGTAVTDVAAQLNADSTFKGFGLTASMSGNTLTIHGQAGSTQPIVLGTGTGANAVQDTTHTGIVTTNNVTTGAPGTAGTKTLTFATTGSNITGSISVNGESISGASANAIYTAINADTTLQADHVTATIASNVVTIHGDPTAGTAPVIGANSLSDSGLGKVATSVGTTLGIANSSLAAFSSGSAGVVGGTIVIGGTNINITASSTGNSVAQQINTAMETANTGITATFNATTKELTINGNASGAALPAINATGLTDSGDVAYSQGVNSNVTVANTAQQSVQTVTFSASTAVLTGAISVGGQNILLSGSTDGTDLAGLISTALAPDGGSASFDDASKTLTIKGAADGSTAPTIDTSGLTDSGGAIAASTTVFPAETASIGTTTLAAFSSGTASTIGGNMTINGHAISITANSNGTSVANQINSQLVSDGVAATQESASFDTTTKVLTITGATDGSTGPGTVVNNLTDSGDEHPYSGIVTTNSTTTTGNVTMSIGNSDVLSGSLTVNGNVISGNTSASALASAITTAGAAVGIVANYNSGTGTLTINSNAGDGNPISIGANSLVDATAESVSPVTVTNPVAGTHTSSTLALGGNATAGDTLTGNITFTDSSNGVTNTFNLAAATTTLDNNGTTGLSTRLNANAAFQALGLTASVTGTTLTVKGADGASSSIALGAGTLSDVTNNIVGAATDNVTTGSAGTSATKTLTLNSATDTFKGSININSDGLGNVAVDLDGLTGAQAAQTITNNATLFGQGVSAGWNATTKQLTITGNSSGESLAVTPVTSVADNAAIRSATSTINAQGGPAAGATSAITLGSANDTVSGTLSVVIGTSGLPADSLSLDIASGTSGASLATQVNQNSSFKAAGVTASYNSSTATVTLSGPAGLTNTLNTSASTLTDATSAAPQAGANFTSGTVSTLTALTASQILTTVTAAVADVAYQRGTIGADVNELSSASSVASAESVNLTSAQNTVDATDYGQAASNMSKYQILSQTGISALAQANSVQQEVLKLLQ